MFVDEAYSLTPTHASDFGAEAIARAEELFRRAARRGDFGNGRFARSLFEQAYARMALRAAEDGCMQMNELMELVPEDLEWSEPGVETDERRIGFGDGSQGDERAAKP